MPLMQLLQLPTSTMLQSMTLPLQQQLVIRMLQPHMLLLQQHFKKHKDSEQTSLLFKQSVQKLEPQTQHSTLPRTQPAQLTQVHLR